MRIETFTTSAFDISLSHEEWEACFAGNVSDLEYLFPMAAEESHCATRRLHDRSKRAATTWKSHVRLFSKVVVHFAGSLTELLRNLDNVKYLC